MAREAAAPFKMDSSHLFISKSTDHHHKKTQKPTKKPPWEMQLKRKIKVQPRPKNPELQGGVSLSGTAESLCQPLDDDSVEQVGFLQGLVLVSQLFVGEGGHEDEAGGSHRWPGIHYEEPDVTDPVQRDQTHEDDPVTEHPKTTATVWIHLSIVCNPAAAAFGFQLTEATASKEVELGVRITGTSSQVAKALRRDSGFLSDVKESASDSTDASRCSIPGYNPSLFRKQIQSFQQLSTALKPHNEFTPLHLYRRIPRAPFSRLARSLTSAPPVHSLQCHPGLPSQAPGIHIVFVPVVVVEFLHQAPAVSEPDLDVGDRLRLINHDGRAGFGFIGCLLGWRAGAHHLGCTAADRETQGELGKPK